ncbi:MAG: cupin domain-containing protein [Halioglobus sp.]|nr:cupin domain-containing protein [Halioglobus sp.]
MMKINHVTELETQAVSHNPAITKQVMLAYGDLAPVTQFARATFPPGATAPCHTHTDMLEVFYIEQGRGRIVIDGKSHDLTPGNTIAVEAGEAHELQNTGDDVLVVSYFSVRV